MKRKFFVVSCMLLIILISCGTSQRSESSNERENSVLPAENNYESAEGEIIRMKAGDVEVLISLNDSKASADFVSMLPLELTLIERNEFAKGMTLPRRLSTDEATTRSYEIGDFGYWAAGPDLAIFYDDIYERTIVPVIPMGKAISGAENMRNTAGKVVIELLGDSSNE